MRSILTLLLSTLSSVAANSPSLTIYNGNFAVVRQSFPVKLEPGVNLVTNQDITRFLEPDSVVFRDPTGDADFRILEQNYEGGLLNQALLLKKFEGKEITFRTGINESGYGVFEKGKVIRGGNSPIVQTELGIMTVLPGTPMFPDLGEGALLRPRLGWQIASQDAQSFIGELSYISTRLQWKADYNVVSRDDRYDVVGWVTLTNQSGTRFESAKIKLMAGEVNRVQPELLGRRSRAETSLLAESAIFDAGVTQKAFADFHLYELPHATNLEDQQVKQVEFMNVQGVKGETRYIVDFAQGVVGRYGRGVYQDPGFLNNGEKPKVEKRVYIENSEDNQLGMPIPAGRMRFYQSDEGSLEFIGEDAVAHTPQDETLDLLLGNAFDLVAERTQIDFKVRGGAKWMEETIAYRIANRKDESVVVEIREPLVRARNANIKGVVADIQERPQASLLILKQALEAGEEAKVSYTVEYTW